MSDYQNYDSQSVENSDEDLVDSAPALSKSKGNGTKPIKCSWEFKSSEGK